MIIRICIADDEPVALRRLRRLIMQAPDVEVVAECADGATAVEAIRDLKPDVALLDVQMPELDGFGVVQALGAESLPQVIFVTAYDQYALRAFDVHALDYVLKPVDADRLLLAIDRARARLAARGAPGVDPRVVALLANLADTRRYLSRIPVRSDRGVRLIELSAVDWIEAADNYVTLHGAGGQHLVRDTMTRIEGQLDPRQFVRIHRSAIVRLASIHELFPAFHGDYTVVLKDGSQLTLTRGYRQKVEQALGRKL
jgi:two-component system, LytTR family, response regulator